MKKFKTLLITGSLLGITTMGVILSTNDSYRIAYAEEETSIEEASSEEITSEEDSQSLEDKILELEELLKQKTNEFLNRELIAGITIGGAIMFAMEMLSLIFRIKFNKKQDTTYDTRFKELQEKFNELSLKAEQISKVSEDYIEKGCIEMNNLKVECSNLLKEIKDIVPQLKQYEKFNQKITTIINILDVISFTPENVKSGISEQVKQLIEEVK